MLCAPRVLAGPLGAFPLARRLRLRPAQAIGPVFARASPPACGRTVPCLERPLRGGGSAASGQAGGDPGEGLDHPGGGAVLLGAMPGDGDGAAVGCAEFGGQPGGVVAGDW